MIRRGWFWRRGLSIVIPAWRYCNRVADSRRLRENLRISEPRRRIVQLLPVTEEKSPPGSA